MPVIYSQHGAGMWTVYRRTEWLSGDWRVDVVARFKTALGCAFYLVMHRRFP